MLLLGARCVFFLFFLRLPGAPTPNSYRHPPPSTPPSELYICWRIKSNGDVKPSQGEQHILAVGVYIKRRGSEQMEAG